MVYSCTTTSNSTCVGEETRVEGLGWDTPGRRGPHGRSRRGPMGNIEIDLKDIGQGVWTRYQSA